MNRSRVLSIFMALRHDTKLFSNCKQCMYFEPRNHPFTDRLSKCRRFGEIDENGRVSYEYADLCRKNEQKCGMAGKYFEKWP
uniref:Uncharacterized protein n=1 Tax=viral metagenome TaxID=1070528 RepID=A0A6C0AI41_9ZZZZ